MISQIQKSLIFIGLLLLIPHCSIVAQDDVLQTNENIQDVIETISENSETEADASEIIERLENFKNKHIDLNKTDFHELDKLGLLSPFQINALLDYRTINGPFVSLNELLSIEGFTDETIHPLSDYVSIDSKNAQQMLMPQYRKNQIVTSISAPLEEQNGFKDATDSTSNKHFEGNAIHLKSKYMVEFTDKLSLGLTLEKDAGESFMKGSNKFSDFYSGFIEVKPNNFIKQIIIGDFNANFGQGLVLWNGFALGKSGYTLGIRKPNDGFSHYTSTNESLYFRGIATSYKLGNYTLNLFYSSKWIDANMVNSDSIGNSNIVSSLQETGMHRLTSELRGEKNLKENSLGSNVCFEKGKLKLGATFLQTKYSVPFEKSEKPYKAFDFSGNEINAAGLNFVFRNRYWELFGESAYSSNGGYAGLVGGMFKVNSRASFSILYRNFEASYFSPYANAFRQGSKTSNEKGVYTGLEYILTKNWRISTYIDIYTFPWMKYTISEPFDGFSYFIESKIDLTRSSHFNIRYTINKSETEQKNDTAHFVNTVSQNLQRLRMQLIYSPTEEIELRNRLEWSLHSIGTENTGNGFLVNQDIIWKPTNSKLSITVRYEIFETNSWESRIYTYENDFLYSYSVPALAGKGIRTYIMVKFWGFRNIQFSARYGLTVYTDKTSVGTGTSEIAGNRKSDLGFQAILRF